MQDWTPVVLRSATKKMSSTVKKSPYATRSATATATTTATTTATSAAAQTIANLEKNEMKPSKMLSADSRTTLIQKRAALKLTQVQLNQRCSFGPNMIRDFESGVLCPSNAQLNLLNRILGGGLHLG